MFCTSLDRNYLPFGKLYLLSIAKNAPDERVFISTVNLTMAEVSQLCTYNQKCIIENHKITIPETIRYRQYMQCRISHVLLEAYYKFEGQDKLIIATDVDMLIRKPMDELRALAIANDLLLKVDITHLKAKEIQNGIIVFKSNNKNILSFLKFYNEMWEKEIRYRDDQRQLFKAVNEFQDVLRFGQIPHDYVDGLFNSNSHIWSAHVHNRFYNYNKFLAELGLPEVKTCSNLSWIGQGDGRI